MKRPRKRTVALAAFALAAPALFWVGCATTRAGYESAAYTTVSKDGRFELRDYPDLPVASTTGENTDPSFRRLFKYITGENEGDQKIAMTTPVFMAGDGSAETMSFVVPADTHAAGTPAPTAANVELDTLPAGRFAVLRFKGSQKSAAPAKALNELRTLLDEKNLTPSGPPRFAYYDPPWTPQSLRRNEVMLRVDPE